MPTNDLILLNDVRKVWEPGSFQNKIYYSSIDTRERLSTVYKSSFSIKYVLDGEEVYYLDDQRHVVRAGQYFIINNEREVEATAKGKSQGVSFFIDSSVIQEVHASLKSNGLVVEPEYADPVNFFENTYGSYDALGTNLSMLAQQVKYAVHRNQAITDEWCYDLSEILITSQLDVCRSINQLDRVRRITREELYRKALLARDYLHDTLDQPFLLYDVSQASGMSKYQLIRVFSQLFGSTPYRYLSKLRVARAQDLLAQSDHNISDISDMCGFDHIVTFSRAFKAMTGVSPGRYRKI